MVRFGLVIERLVGCASVSVERGELYCAKDAVDDVVEFVVPELLLLLVRLVWLTAPVLERGMIQIDEYC